MIFLMCVIVVVINVVANSNNYNINIPEDRHMDIRVRRNIDINQKNSDNQNLDDDVNFAKNLYDYTHFLFNNELGEGDDDIKIKFNKGYDKSYKDEAKKDLNKGNVVNGIKYNQINNAELSKTAHIKNDNKDFENRLSDIKIKAKSKDINIVYKLKGADKQTRIKRQFSNTYYDNIYRTYNNDRQSVTYSPYTNPNYNTYTTKYNYYTSNDIYRREDITYKPYYNTESSRQYYSSIRPYDSYKANYNNTYNTNSEPFNSGRNNSNYIPYGNKGSYTGYSQHNYSYGQYNNDNYKTNNDYSTKSGKSYDDYRYNNNYGPYNNDLDGNNLNYNNYNQDTPHGDNNNDLRRDNNVNYNSYNQNTPGNDNGIKNVMETTTMQIILESCFLCRSLGCPKNYKRVWSGCVLDNDYN